MKTFLAAVAIASGQLASSWAQGAEAERARMELADEVAAMLSDLPAAASTLSPHSPVRQAIEAGDQESARRMLEFRPLAEAPTPEGFPSFTPVGMIQLKTYPAYRKAEGPGFWPLFRHIQSENLPMTAPVEMARSSPAAESGQSRAPMAFLYQHTGVGQTGPANGVSVTDAEPTLAVSLGMTGRPTAATLKDARQRLEAWLADHPDYRQASEQPWRFFGYNSPMVPDSDKYWEAQLLVELVEKAALEPATSEAPVAP